MTDGAVPASHQSYVVASISGSGLADKTHLHLALAHHSLIGQHMDTKPINTQILIACLYKRSIVCGLQQVYIFYINHLLKITDLEKSFCTVHYIRNNSN